MRIHEVDCENTRSLGCLLEIDLGCLWCVIGIMLLGWDGGHRQLALGKRFHIA